MSDDEYEDIYDAAEKTGLLARGMNNFVMFALSSEECKNTYLLAVREIVSTECFVRHLTPQVVAYCTNEMF